MLAKSATKIATAALLALAAVQAANAQQLHGNGVETQPSSATTLHSLPGFAPSASAPGMTRMSSPVWAPTEGSGPVAPAVLTPSSQPTLQQIRR